MATKMILPMLGQTMEEGTITKWLKKEGDSVEKGEPLLEVMTDKVNMEVESPTSGILRKIVAQEDETVPIMELIAIIGTADEPIDDLLAGGGEAAPAAEPEAPKAAEAAPVAETAPAAVVESSSRIIISPRAKHLATENSIAIDILAGRGTGPNGRIVEKDVQAFIAEAASAPQVKATPLAAKIASEEGISLTEIIGSGPQGKVMKNDVLQAVAPIPTAPSGEDIVIPFAGMRKMVADNVAKSAQTAPHVTLTLEVDMTDAVKIRSQVVGEFEKKYGIRLSFTDMVIKAAAMAIEDHKIINGRLQGNEIRIPADVNVGFAVALDGALIVPVIHKVNMRTLAEISLEIKRLSGKAREGKLASEEITGGTFSISNLGTYSIDVFNPIITPGQTAILGVCRIAEKPVVKDGQIVVRSMMNLCLSFDHRVLDGAPAAQYLQKVKELLESPWQLII
ncbi:MAG: dihydrolipoamide acetyltransferase family protein [Armatimonadota bacterium]